MPEGIVSRRYMTITRNGPQANDGQVIQEIYMCMSVNGHELATIACSPIQQEALALGFLANEGLIASLDDVKSIHLSKGSSCVDVWLAHDNFKQPDKRIITSGCGGGLTFDDLSGKAEPLTSNVSTTPELAWARMDDLNQSGTLYSQARGVHTAGISDGEKLLLVAEDVGRHNTLDKLRGMALQAGLDLRDNMLFSTGRVSSEMINKARSMQLPIVCSRTSPTSMSVALAEAWGITLVGYLRRNSMNVYTHPQRLGLEPVAGGHKESVHHI